MAYEVTRLSPTEFEQHVVPHNISGLGPQAKAGSWAAQRHHHIDAQQLPSGEWIAAVDGDSVPSAPISQRAIWTGVRVALPLVLAAGLCVAIGSGTAHKSSFRRRACSTDSASELPLIREAHKRIGLRSAVRRTLVRRPQGWTAHAPAGTSRCWCCSVHAQRVAALTRFLLLRLPQLDTQLRFKDALLALGLGTDARSPPMWPPHKQRQQAPSAWRLLQRAALAAALIGAAVLYAFVAPYRQAAAPVAVGGQHSQFTLLCMSYDARLPTLQHLIRHYSRCPSVNEIVLVWNKGEAAGVCGSGCLRAAVLCYNVMTGRRRPCPPALQARPLSPTATSTALCRCGCGWRRSTR